MLKQLDPPITYAVLLAKHKCQDCGSPHQLRPHPDPDGWSIVVACSKCRDRVGLTRRYSTEVTGLQSLDVAEMRVKRMLEVVPLLPTEVLDAAA